VSAQNDCRHANRLLATHTAEERRVAQSTYFGCVVVRR